LQTPEHDSASNDVIDPSAVQTNQAAGTPPGPVAPVWHTAVLIAGIVLISVAGVFELSGPQPAVNRLQTYAFTAASELCMLGWVYFGLRLRKVPFLSLLGSVPGNLRSIATDVGFAMLFWVASLMVLGTIGVFWTVIEAAITHHPLFSSGKQLSPDSTQQQAIHALTQLAPASGVEVGAWVLVCVIAGIAEESIFRGYFQRQFTAWAHGGVAVGVALSALLFGAAHGYQGPRNMVLLAVFGALFSLLALFRRSLRAGIFAHSWHDLIAGLTLALLKAHHIV
jgi:membrane protease YdiL (CAAX protease family)